MFTSNNGKIFLILPITLGGIDWHISQIFWDSHPYPLHWIITTGIFLNCLKLLQKVAEQWLPVVVKVHRIFKYPQKKRF